VGVKKGTVQGDRVSHHLTVRSWVIKESWKNVILELMIQRFSVCIILIHRRDTTFIEGALYNPTSNSLNAALKPPSISDA
jgi:hypothetical protein